MSIDYRDRRKENIKAAISVAGVVLLLAFVVGSLIVAFSKESQCRNAKNGFAYNELGCSAVTGVDFNGNPVKK